MTDDHVNAVLAEIRELRVEIKHDSEKLKKLDYLLSGNGDPSKGLIVRVDRIERATGYAISIASAAFTTGVGLLGTVLTWFFSRD